MKLDSDFHDFCHDGKRVAIKRPHVFMRPVRPASRRGKVTEHGATPKHTDYAALDPDDKRKQGFFLMMTIHGCVIIGW